MEKWQVKQKLDDELQSIKFTKQTEVLGKLKQPTWREKLHAFWNKEIAIPILPVSTAVVVLFFGFGYFTIEEYLQEIEQINTIEISGNIYLEHELERRISDEQ